MINSLDQFIDIVEDQLAVNAGALHKQASVDMLQRFARDTPVDTGYATANWTASIGKPNLTPLDRKDKSITARKTAKIALDNLKALSIISSDVYVSNAVQGRRQTGKTLKSGKLSTKRFNSSFNDEGYIIGLEDGKSTQAPTGMFLKNVFQSQSIIDKSRKKIFKEARASI